MRCSSLSDLSSFNTSKRYKGYFSFLVGRTTGRAFEAHLVSPVYCKGPGWYGSWLQLVRYAEVDKISFHRGWSGGLEVTQLWDDLASYSCGSVIESDRVYWYQRAGSGQMSVASGYSVGICRDDLMVLYL